MSNITIKSCRNDTERLAFAWPGTHPDEKGEFDGKVVCTVIKPHFPQITPEQIAWAVDSAHCYATNDGCDVEEIVILQSLKDWIKSAKIEIIAPSEMEEVAKDNKITRLEAEVEELRGMTLVLKAQAAEFKAAGVPIPEREFKFERAKHVVARHHAKRTVQPPTKEQEIRNARTERSKVCEIL